MKLRGFAGGEYVLWDAFENKAVRRHSGDGSINLTVAPNNLLVLFTNTGFIANDGKLICESDAVGEELKNEWKIELCCEKELPDYRTYKTVSELRSISAPDEMPGFTGNMRYTAKVQLDPEKHKMLDLGAVGQTAEVRLNGKYVGTRLFAPYRFDISEYVKAGENLLEITVANTCVYEQSDKFSRYMLIKPSGLLGPVTVR